MRASGLQSPSSNDLISRQAGVNATMTSRRFRTAIDKSETPARAGAPATRHITVELRTGNSPMACKRRKSVGAPTFTTNPLVYEKQPIGVIRGFYGRQTQVIASPKRSLPR